MTFKLPAFFARCCLPSEVQIVGSEAPSALGSCLSNPNLKARNYEDEQGASSQSGQVDSFGKAGMHDTLCAFAYDASVVKASSCYFK